MLRTTCSSASRQGGDTSAAARGYLGHPSKVVTFGAPVGKHINKYLGAALWSAVEGNSTIKLHNIEAMFRDRLVSEFDRIPSPSTIWKHLTERRKVRRRLNRKHV
jgi:hypothetical protein